MTLNEWILVSLVSYYFKINTTTLLRLKVRNERLSYVSKSFPREKVQIQCWKLLFILVSVSPSIQHLFYSNHLANLGLFRFPCTLEEQGTVGCLKFDQQWSSFWSQLCQELYFGGQLIWHWLQFAGFVCVRHDVAADTSWPCCTYAWEQYITV